MHRFQEAAADTRATHRHRRRALMVFVALATFASTSAEGQDRGSVAATAETSGDSAEVLVSRTEARVRFAPDTSTRWEWPPMNSRGFMWAASVSGMNGETFLSAILRPTNSLPPRTLSLADLVAASTVSLCRSGGMQGRICVNRQVISASVEGRRVVLTLRDTLEISNLFGLHPDSVMILTDRPGTAGSGMTAGHGRVRYLDPQLPAPDSAQRAEAGRTRRRMVAEETSLSRAIVASIRVGGWNGFISLAVGDSIELAIEDGRCQLDFCSPLLVEESAARDWGRWTLSDSSVAQIHRVTRPSQNVEWYYDRNRVMLLVGLRPGRTAITASGVHTAADTIPSRTPVDSVVTREVLVTVPIGRVILSPRPTTMRVHEPLDFTARVLDRSGHRIVGAPAEIMWGTPTSHIASIDSATITFDQPGRREIIATAGARADTLIVDVIGTTAPR